jgi:hypothetical protein
MPINTIGLGTAPAATPQPEYGLQVLYVDADTVSLSPGRIMADDESTMMEVSATTNFDLSTMASRPTSDLAYPWLGVDSGGTPSFWVDTSKTSPTETPAGIVAKRYIGPAIYQFNPSSNVAFSTSRAGRTVTIRHQELEILSTSMSSGTGTVSSDFSAIAPADSDIVTMNLGMFGGYQALLIHHDATTTARIVSLASQNAGVSGDRNQTEFQTYVKGLVTGGTIYLKATTTTSTQVNLRVVGHTETI